MKFITIMSADSTLYIDSDRFHEWYSAGVKYHYIQPDMNYEETWNTEDLSDDTFCKLKDMILNYTSNLDGLTSLITERTDVLNPDFPYVFEWVYDLCEAKIREFYPGRYTIQKVPIDGKNLIAIFSNIWDSGFLIDISRSFLIGHFDQFYIQYDDHYFDFSPQKISVIKGMCPLASKQYEWFYSYYHQNEDANYYLNLDENIYRPEQFFNSPRDSSAVNYVWEIVQTILENGQIDGYPVSDLFQNALERNFIRFCNNGSVESFQLKITKDLFEYSDSEMIKVSLNNDEFCFDIWDDYLSTIKSKDEYDPFMLSGQSIAIRVFHWNGFFGVSKYGTERLRHLSPEEWQLIEIIG